MKSRPVSQILAAGLLIVGASLPRYFDLPGFELGIRPENLLVLLAILCLSLPWLWGAKAKRVAGIILGAEEVPPDPAPQGTILWPAAGLAFVIALLAFLEWRQPFYFTQDDNLSQFLPIIVGACRQVAHGSFSNWNPYQFMGAPTASLGVYALTYPPTYLCYGLARYLLGNEYLTLELFLILHLLGGFAAMYWAARCHGARPSLCSLAAACTVLSGFALLASRAWYYMGPVFLWAPLLVVGFSRLQQGRSNLRWIVGMGLVTGAFFHAGNVQMWAYAILLLGLVAVVLLISGNFTLRQFGCLSLALWLGAAISLPLLLPQLQATRNVFRVTREFTGSLFPSLIPFLIPAAWVEAPGKVYWGGNEIVYSGTLFFLAAAIALATLVPYRWSREILRKNFWLIAAAIALLFALGNHVLLWQVLVQLPLLSKFRLPFKFLAFFNIFIAIGGAVVFERLLQRVRRPLRWELLLVICVCGLLAAHTRAAKVCFYSYNIRPYPSLPTGLKTAISAAQSNYRILPILPSRSPAKDYGEGLPHNLPTLYGTYSLDGYDPLVRLEPGYRWLEALMERRPLDTMRELGVRYVLYHRLAAKPEFSGDDAVKTMELYTNLPRPLGLAALAAGTPVYHDNAVTVLELPQTRPLAFDLRNPQVPLPVHVDGLGADIGTSGLPAGSTVIFNVQWRFVLAAYAANQRIPTAMDEWGRVVLRLPSPVASVRIRYETPWKTGLLAGLLMFGLWILAVRMAQHWHLLAEDPAQISEDRELVGCS